MVEEVTAYKINNEHFVFFFAFRISDFEFCVDKGHQDEERKLFHPPSNVGKDTFFCLVILRWLRALKSPTREFFKTMENLQMPRDKKSKIKITSLRIPQYRGYYDCFYNLKGSSYIWCNKVNQDLRQFLMDRKEKPIVARLRNNLVNHTDLSLKQRTAPIYVELKFYLMILLVQTYKVWLLKGCHDSFISYRVGRMLLEAKFHTGN